MGNCTIKTMHININLARLAIFIDVRNSTAATMCNFLNCETGVSRQSRGPNYGHPLKPPGPSQHYMVSRRFQQGPQLCPHDAERRQFLGVSFGENEASTCRRLAWEGRDFAPKNDGFFSEQISIRLFCTISYHNINITYIYLIYITLIYT